MVHHLTATGRRLPYGITLCYLPPDTSERALRLFGVSFINTRQMTPAVPPCHWKTV